MDLALAQTLDSINAVCVGPGTIADLALPNVFKRRAADRILRASFEATFRRVEQAAKLRDDLDVAAYRASHRSLPTSDYPARRGATFKTLALPTSLNLANVATLVARDLARLGLVEVVQQTIERLKPQPSSQTASQPETYSDDILESLGLPIDLYQQAFDYFDNPDADYHVRSTFDKCHARADDGSASAQLVILTLPRFTDPFGTTDGGPLDSARAAINAILPLVDVLLFVHEPLCTQDRIALLHTLLGVPAHLASRLHVQPWPCPPAQFIRDIGVPMTSITFPDQQSSPEGTTTSTCLMLLASRYPSRGELGAPIAHEEAQGFAAAILNNQRFSAKASSLILQGGDILITRQGRHAHGLALVGEATIARNIALGLDKTFVHDLLTRELGVEQLIVLPAAAFHVDCCVSLLATPSGPVALIADPIAAAAHILVGAARTLRDANIFAPAYAQTVEDALARVIQSPIQSPIQSQGPHTASTAAFMLTASACATVVETISQHVLAPFAARAPQPGLLPAAFARALSLNDADGGTANALRTLHALDTIAALHEQPWEKNASPHICSYYASLRRVNEDLREVASCLQGILPIQAFPSGIAGPRTCPTINMIHLGTGHPATSYSSSQFRESFPYQGGAASFTTLLPTFGGISSVLDVACQRILKHIWKDACAGVPTERHPHLAIVPIPSGETALRDGATRCSLLVL